MLISNSIKTRVKASKHYYRYFSTCNACRARHRKIPHYDVLQVHQNADHRTIKSQYYKLSKLYHPDLNPGNKEAHQKFLEVNDAYAVLGSESKRREYDMENDHMSSATTSPGIRRTGPAASWNFKPRASRQTGSSSAQAQAEGFRSTKSNDFNYNEWYARHYEAEEIRRRERLARRQGRDIRNQDAKFEPDTTLWSRFWRLGAVILGIMYITSRARELKEKSKEEPENSRT
jgi:curved DNA-binding protein CbpA